MDRGLGGLPGAGLLQALAQDRGRPPPRVVISFITRLNCYETAIGACPEANALDDL